MSKNKVYIKMNDEIKNALIVKGQEDVSKNIIQFLDDKGERFHFKEESGKYYINSFYPTIPSKTWNRFIQGFNNITQEIKRVPIQADIVVTGKCHCSCWHCFRIKDKREDLSFKEIKRCFDEFMS